jgi:hypothetical protein
MVGQLAWRDAGEEYSGLSIVASLFRVCSVWSFDNRRFNEGEGMAICSAACIHWFILRPGVYVSDQ